MYKEMDNEMEAGFLQGFIGIKQIVSSGLRWGVHTAVPTTSKWV